MNLFNLVFALTIVPNPHSSGSQRPSADSDLLSVLVILDLTATFDTVSHNILLSCLQAQLGVRDAASAWFASYLSNLNCHTQCSSRTSFRPPLLYLHASTWFHYSSPWPSVSLHADDSQIYLCSKPFASLPPSSLLSCLQDIKHLLSIRWFCPLP